VDTALPLVEKALGQLGYTVHTLRNPNRASLAAAVGDELDTDDACLVVHAVAHGRTTDDTDRPDAVPSCGTVGSGTTVAGWLSAARRRGHPVLFLLDLCRSERAARPAWPTERASRDTRAWVIAGSGPNEDSFSRSVAAVLTQLAEDGLDTDPSRRHVTFRTVARHIATNLDITSGHHRTVHATPIDPAAEQPDPEFFPNPRYEDDPQRRTRQAIESPLRTFLDELDDVFDPEHFLGRVGTHFAGRRRQLLALSPWLDGVGGTGSLRVVTGSPGVGKSALLAAVVCSAHPVLADLVPHVRARLAPAACPSRNDDVGAVHARQRTVDELMSSLGHQLRLSAPALGWTPPELVRAISELPAVPVIVVDAIDEALEPRRVMSDLLLPLASARHGDETPVCRLLVGMRPWPGFERLRRLAAESGGLVDLDTVPVQESRNDLREYLSLLLADLPAYAPTAQRPVRRQFATAIAERLGAEADTRLGRPSWGAFLLAGLFAGHLGSTEAVTDPVVAKRVGASVPRYLPDVLELDLGVRRDGGALLAMLAALAHAKGEGMPAEVAELIAGAFPGGGRAGSALRAALRYARTSVEEDGTTLYRLSHQSLADHLRDHPMAVPGDGTTAASRVFDLLLDSVHNGQWRNWSAAPPYLLRHAIHHAVDAGRVDTLLADTEFLVHADASTLRSVLDDPTHGGLAGEVYRTSLADHRRADPGARRWILAIDAARNGAPALARGLCPTGWLPRWASGLSLADPGARPTTWLTAVTCTVLDGDPVVVTVDNVGRLRLWRLDSGRSMEPTVDHRHHISCVASAVVDGKPCVLTGCVNGMVHVWDPGSGHRVRTVFHNRGRVNAIARTRIGGRSVAVVCGDDRTCVYDLDSGLATADTLSDGRWTRAVACHTVAGRSIAVTVGNDRAVRVWDLATMTRTGAPPREHADRIYAAACLNTGDTDIAVTGGEDDVLRVWDLGSGRAIGPPLAGHGSWIYAVACATIDGRAVAISGGFDRTVRVWDLTTHECLSVLRMPAPVHAITIAPDGAVVVCTGQDVVVLDHVDQESW
jgi:hypothetical protein